MEAKDMLAMTPFLMAVTMGGSESAKVLLDHGADITAIDSSLNSCLHLAVMYERAEIVKVLLERDTDKSLIQSKDKDLRSVFHSAAGLKNSEVKIYLYFYDNCRNSRALIAYFLLSICGQTHEFKIHATRQRARADNLTICDRKKTN